LAYLKKTITSRVGPQKNIFETEQYRVAS